MNLTSSTLEFFPHLLVSQNDIEFRLAQTDAGLRLVVLGDSVLADFDGKRSELGGRTLNLCALTPKNAAAMRNAPVTVCLDAQNNVTLLYKGKPLNYTIFHQQAKKAEIVHAKQIDFTLQNQGKAHKPAPNHPWRKGFTTLFSKQNVPQGDISTSRD